MKKLLFLPALVFLFISCDHAIKNADAKVEVEEGTEVTGEVATKPLLDEVVPHADIDTTEPIGYWVGFFEQDVEKGQTEDRMWLDEGLYWNKNNKINISIDEIRDTIVIGHSVVAGNDRPFSGTVQQINSEDNQSNTYIFKVAEPGDDRYDGTFTFQIADGKLNGKWEAYKEINIKRRKYSLEKKKYQYDPNIELEHVRAYADWKKASKNHTIVEGDGQDTNEWIQREFVSATNEIYNINASNTLLARADVENLKKGDLSIIRNTIYARHGYSFKNQPLRVFFDAQSWYIPVHADITNTFTEIELQNIKLLLSFEKNAAEYYDSFGRG